MVKPIDTKFKALLPNGLFIQASQLGAAVWFYLWCVARTTKEIVYDDDEIRYGSVLGGMPVCFEVIRQDFPDVSNRTAHRWRKTCVKAGIIRAKRTPLGYTIEVIRSQKFPDKEPERRTKWIKSVQKVESDGTKKSNQIGQKSPIATRRSKSDVQKTQIRCAENANHFGSDVQKTQIHIEVKGRKEVKGDGKGSALPTVAPVPFRSKAKPLPTVAAAKTRDLTVTEKTQISMMLSDGKDARTIAARLELPDILVQSFMAEHRTAGGV